MVLLLFSLYGHRAECWRRSVIFPCRTGRQWHNITPPPHHLPLFQYLFLNWFENVDKSPWFWKGHGADDGGKAIIIKGSWGMTGCGAGGTAQKKEQWEKMAVCAEAARPPRVAEIARNGVLKGADLDINQSRKQWMSLWIAITIKKKKSSN